MSNLTPDFENPLLPSTRWTEWLEPIRQNNPDAEAAVERLCRAYWRPIYCYIRGRNYTHHRSEELAQEFVASLLRRDALARADRSRGRFRSYLLASLKNFLASDYVARDAQKRIPEHRLESLEEKDCEIPSNAGEDVADFDKEWARATLDRARVQLGKELRAQGKGELFADLRSFLSSNHGGLPRPELAAKMGVMPSTLDVMILRLRARYRELLQEEINRTVATPEQARDEFVYLVHVVGAANLLEGSAAD